MKRTELERLRAMGAASLAAAAERVKRQTPEQRRAAFRDRLVELADSVVEAVSTGDLGLLNAAENGLRQALLVARTLMGTNAKDRRDPAAWAARWAAEDLATHAATIEARRALEARDEQVMAEVVEVSRALRRVAIAAGVAGAIRGRGGEARNAATIEAGGATAERVAEAVAVLRGHRQTDGRAHESDRAAALVTLLDRRVRVLRDARPRRRPTAEDARAVAHAYCETFPADAARLEGLMAPVLVYLETASAPPSRGAGRGDVRKKAIGAALAGVLRAAGVRPARLDSLKRQARRKRKGGQ